MAEINDWSTSAASNNSASPNGAPENMAPSGVNNTMRENMAVLKRAYADSNASVTAGGTVDVITVAMNQTITALYNGLIVSFEASGTNTGAVTLNVDGVGAKNLVKRVSTALVAGEILSGMKVSCVYDGVRFQIMSAFLDAAVSTSEAAAAASAAAALVSENAAAADLVLTGLDVVASGNDVSATNADVVLTAADVVTTAAAVTAMTGTSSTTSLLIEVASKAFTVASGLGFVAGDWVLVTSGANPDANYMHGPISSYTGTTLTVNVDNIGGSGTLADWTIRRSGTQGATGTTGATGATGATGPAGSGDVVGPASATDGAVAKFDGTTGKLLKDGVVLGTVATLNTGTGNGNIPVLDAVGLPAIDGSQLTGLTGGGPSLGTDSVIRTNAQTISENITFAGTENGMSAGPITIATGFTVTVGGSSVWSIV